MLKGEKAVEILNDVISGKILPVFLLLLSVFFLFYLKGRPFRGLFKMLSGIRENAVDGIAPKRAVMMALAGTLGVGNIAGVADAINKGGPGVLFWMWVSSIAAMVIKFAEVTLSLRCRKYDGNDAKGGPMYYLPRPFGAIFALICLLCALSVGSVMQTAACRDAARVCLPAGASFLSVLLPPLLAGALMLTVFAGKKKLFDLSVRLVPAMTVLYTLLCLIVIGAHIRLLPSVFLSICKGAFGIGTALRGSAAGFFTALRFGLIRGILSNEAGCGTSPIAHASSSAKSGAAQGALGVIEVAVDTLLLCSLTGLAVLCAGSAGRASSPICAVLSAFSSVFGKLSSYLLLAALLPFAFATLVCWSFYAKSCLLFLFSHRALITAGMLVFCAFAAFGPLVPERFLWQVSDLSAALMTLLNCSALFARRRDIKEETTTFFDRFAARRRSSGIDR